MARPKKENPRTAKMDFRLHQELKALLDQIAEREERPASQICEFALRQYVREYCKKNKIDDSSLDGLR